MGKDEDLMIILEAVDVTPRRTNEVNFACETLSSPIFSLKSYQLLHQTKRGATSAFGAPKHDIKDRGVGKFGSVNTSKAKSLAAFYAKLRFQVTPGSEPTPVPATRVIGRVRLPFNDQHICGRPVCLSLLAPSSTEADGGKSLGELEVTATLMAGLPKTTV